MGATAAGATGRDPARRGIGADDRGWWSEQEARAR